MKTKIHSDVFVGIVLEALCLFFFLYGRKLPDAAKAFPNILLLLIALLSLSIIISGVKKSRSIRSGEKIKDIESEQIKAPLIVFAVSVAYYFLFRYMGYFIATPVMLIGLMLYFGVRNWKPLVLIPIGYLAFTYLLFVWQLGVRLV